MKLLWLSNVPLANGNIKTTGTWIEPLAEGLCGSRDVQIAVVALGSVKKCCRADQRNIKQLIVPSRYACPNAGLPPADLIQQIKTFHDEFAPDIVHVWGTETFWGLLISRGHLHTKALLEIQGLKKPYADTFLADLSIAEQFACIGVKEILKRKTLWGYRDEYRRWGVFEDEIIKGFRFIDVQSDWVRAHVEFLNPDAELFDVHLPLRKPFYRANARVPAGDHTKQERSIFCLSAGPTPYKGLHTAIRALAHLVKQNPYIRLKIAGNIHAPGIRHDGYAKWLESLSAHERVTDHIDWLGPLSSEQIVSELGACDVNLVCSFAETYCVALAEGMYLGVPTVAAFNGGTSWLGTHRDDVLMFQPGDSISCADRIMSILDNPELSQKLSDRSREKSRSKHDLRQILERQIEIYESVCRKRAPLLA